jgi:hypothetical protein
MNKKRTNFGHASLFIATAIMAMSGMMFHASGQNTAPSQTPTPQMLQGKQFRFTWKTTTGTGANGFLTLQKDGALSGGTGSPNESFWSMDELGHLIFKSRDGRIATIFTHGEQREGKWFFSGTFQFRPGVEHLLEEVSAEAVVKDHWSKPLTDARTDFQNSNDRESADFVGNILNSFERPGGMSPAALEGDFIRIKSRVRELVRHGALESAASLNWAQWRIAQPTGPGANGPAHPNQKTGGTPGPGGLVLYLPFDTPDVDGVVRDASGAGNDGRVFGATWVPDGKFGGAYHFSITNITDRIVIPNSDTLNPDYVTVTAWIKAADTDGFWNRIMDKDFRYAYCLDLGGDYNGKVHREKLQFESSRGTIEASGRVLNDNRWHHVAAVYDGQTVRCYLDGTGPSHPAKNGPLKKSTWDLCIGNSVVDYPEGDFLAFNGLIDEVRIYNRALSEAEVKTLATATQPGVDVVPAPSADNGAKPDPAERLKKVKALYDQGLINKEDYDKKVKEIMDSL